MDGVAFNRDDKFDLQLGQALIDERRLGEIFSAARIGSVELKSESWLWEITGNLCVEYWSNGRPSGISVTKADYWVHELKRDGETLVYLMFPMERLKALTRKAIQCGKARLEAGDGGTQRVALIPIRNILA